MYTLNTVYLQVSLDRGIFHCVKMKFLAINMQVDTHTLHLHVNTSSKSQEITCLVCGYIFRES